MSIDEAAVGAAVALEERVLRVLRNVTTGPHGPDVVAAGQVFAVVATGGAVRVLLDAEKIPAGSEDALGQTLAPLVEKLPGVERVVVKPRPRVVSRSSALPGVRHLVAIHSGKGGVGKSTLAANVAVALADLGQRVGLLDADVYGPSIPTLFGLSGRAQAHADGKRVQPLQAHGVRLMSLGFLLPGGQPLIWRGSLVDQGLTQLLTDVAWGRLDCLLVDLPPGTSDVHLALARQAPISGVIAVTSPGQVSVDDVRRGMEMFADLSVPCLGVVENMAGVRCRRCGQVGPLFGEDGGVDLAAETGLPLLARIPFDPTVVIRSDHGSPVVQSEPGSDAAVALRGLALELARRLCLETCMETAV